MYAPKHLCFLSVSAHCFVVLFGYVPAVRGFLSLGMSLGGLGGSSFSILGVNGCKGGRYVLRIVIESCVDGGGFLGDPSHGHIGMWQSQQK